MAQKATPLDEALPSGALLDQYIIERAIAHGGFSTVYIARQLSDQQQVIIKEYKPASITRRIDHNVEPICDQAKLQFQRGRTLFLEEARLLSSLKHPNIVNVLNFFLANETAYLVMNYDYGSTLGAWLKEPDNIANDAFLLDIFPAVLRCIKNMHHRGLLHLDIKPDNILLRPQNNPLILDFGAAMPFKNHRAHAASTFTKGYSAPELYSSESKLGPWSDVYAIGASMRACLDKKAPPENTHHQQNSFPLAAVKHKNTIHPSLLKAIDWAMQAEPKKRPQSVDDLLRTLAYL